jgi:acyl transferase domain-containing protein
LGAEASSERDPKLFLLSARSQSALREGAENLARCIEADRGIRLRDAAYTLQLGRDAMEERVAVIASTREDLVQSLRSYAQGDTTLAELHHGNVMTEKSSVALLREVHPNGEFLQPLLQQRDLSKLARLWVKGVEVEWEAWREAGARRVRLPGYAFARERYWVPSVEGSDALHNGVGFEDYRSVVPGRRRRWQRCNCRPYGRWDRRNRWRFARPDWQPQFTLQDNYFTQIRVY